MVKSGIQSETLCLCESSESEPALSESPSRTGGCLFKLRKQPSNQKPSNPQVPRANFPALRAHVNIDSCAPPLLVSCPRTSHRQTQASSNEQGEGQRGGGLQGERSPSPSQSNLTTHPKNPTKDSNSSAAKTLPPRRRSQGEVRRSRDGGAFLLTTHPTNPTKENCSSAVPS